MEYYLTRRDIDEYCTALRGDERSAGTIEKYRRDTEAFVEWLNGRLISKEILVAWKEYLISKDYAPCTINSMLAALNGVFRYKEWPFKVKFLRLQHQLFREPERELSREEYNRLLAVAQSTGQERLALIMETICSSGIRISELHSITVEALQVRRATISLKGKIRTILLADKLCKKLLKYAKKQKIASGEIFITRSGRGITRRQVWYEMKRLCKAADVPKSKVFPHNLRRVFAVAFYRVSKDIARLADVLGHSSIETTRIYLTVSGSDQMRQIERLGLIS